MSGINEIYAFLNYLDSQGGFYTTPRSSGCPTFSASVTYNNAVVVTTVRINVSSGPGEGTVHLTEVSGLSASKFHLDFNPDFTPPNFKFDRVMNSLVVSGSSNYKGSYNVVIAPLKTQ